MGIEKKLDAREIIMMSRKIAIDVRLVILT